MTSEISDIMDMVVTSEISDIMEFLDVALQTEGVERVIIDGIVDEGPLDIYLVGMDGVVTEFYADPDETREAIDYCYANQQLLEETYNVDIKSVPEDDLEVRFVFRKRRVVTPETLYRDGTITRDAFAYVQKRYTEGANIAVTGSDLHSINAFINYLLEAVICPSKTVVIDPCRGLRFGAINDALTVISGYDPEVFGMTCQMNPNRIVSTIELSEKDAVSLHSALERGTKVVCAMPDDGNGYVTKAEVNNFDLEIEIENLNDDDDEDEFTNIRVKTIREINRKGKSKIISQYFNSQHDVNI